MDRRSLLCGGKIGHLLQITLHLLRRAGIHKPSRDLARFARFAARCQHERPRTPCHIIVLLQQRQQHPVGSGLLTSQRQRYRLPYQQILGRGSTARQLVVLLSTGKIAEQVEC